MKNKMKKVPTSTKKVNSAKQTYNKKFNKKKKADEIFSQADIDRQATLKKQIKDLLQNSGNFKPNFNDRQASIIEGLGYLTLMINNVNKRIKEGELRRFDEKEERELRESLAKLEINKANFEKMSLVICDPVYDKMKNAINLEATAQALLNEDDITKNNAIKAQESIASARELITKNLDEYKGLNNQLKGIGDYIHKESFEKFFATTEETAQSIKDGQIGKVINYDNLSALTKLAISELASQENSTSEFTQKLQESSEASVFDEDFKEVSQKVKKYVDTEKDLAKTRKMDLS
ncbi:MAG: hypothetical protein DRG78_00180 [Epsilonproteobacteria bacterium]|nr:MAG: hypothetical protein DRG78_00180 [Campylobacterota bacterium]